MTLKKNFYVVYFLAFNKNIHILCAFKKTTQKTELRYLELAQQRLREIL